MQLNLMDVNKFVKVNPTMIGEVTNPIFLDRNKTPTYDGLLSTEIFGNTTKERSRKFGFISLGGYYFQPIIYKNIRRLDRRIDGICAGRIKVVIQKDGTMVEDQEKGQTGIEFLYKNWEKIHYKKNESAEHNDRVNVLENHSKNEIFTNVWLVCPAMYRDINMQDVDTRKIGADTVNGIYSRLIRLTAMLKQDASFTPVMHNTRYMIQMTLLIEKKNGMVRKSLLGKNVDYGARLVITAPNYNSNSYKDTEVDFFHAGVPLANCCSLFTPFILGWVRNFLQRELEFIGTKYPIKDDAKFVFKPLKDPMSYYNDEAIRKMMETFIYSYSGRFEAIEIPHEDMDKKHIYMGFYGKSPFSTETEPSPISKRFFTLTDLFFLAASNVCEDKHVYITRYPMTDTMGTFPTGINVLSTIQTTPMEIEGKLYKKYPVVDLSLKPEEVASQFVDTLRFQNVFLNAMNGDYDVSVVNHQDILSK